MNLLLPVLVFFPMAGALASYLAGRRDKHLRDVLCCAFTVAEFAAAALLLLSVLRGASYAFRWEGFCAMGLTFRLDGFRALYGAIAAFMWMMTTLFSPEYFKHYHNRNRYYLFTLLTLGATMGVFLSDDLFTTFVFFEVMSLTSYAWVAHDERAESLRAAETYLYIAVIGGLVTLMGLFLLYSKLGTLAFDGMRAEAAAMQDRSPLYLAGALTFFGFAAKAGMFPLHIWLPKAHAVAPAPASALLSGILTKTGLFGILAVSCNLFLHDAPWGDAVLFFGCVTMFLGALLALFSVNLKRTLACSSMSQIGFILVGVGMQGLLGPHNALAVQGTVLHMVNHSLIKLTLFLCAGVVFMNLHKLELNDIRGFGRGKPLLHAAFLLGALGIAGVPLFNGYISKSLLHESILEYVALLGEAGAAAGLYRFVEILFVVTGGMTLAYMTKLYVALFWEKNDTSQAQFDALNGKYMNRLSAFALCGSAVLLPLLGMLPDVFMTRIAVLAQGFLGGVSPEHAVAYFSSENLMGALKSIVIGAVLYALIRAFLMQKEKRSRAYVNRWPAKLDLEEAVYRPLLTKVLPNPVLVALTRALDELTDSVIIALRHTFLGKTKKHKPVPVGTHLTYALGSLLNGFVWVLNRTVYHRRPIRTDFTVALAAGLEEVQSGGRLITRSVSFGLLLLCIGMYLTFTYLMTL
ncbi:complex I subunit 5 family protein [Beduinella massiliensis]|uniref:complex I subunit 5 family protein n=1 Tax=Beduinella massiliensis TaxID=1852363 RepID=UPI0031F7B6ED